MVKVRIGKYILFGWKDKMISIQTTIDLTVLSINPISAIKKMFIFFLFSYVVMIISRILYKKVKMKMLLSLFIINVVLIEICNLMFSEFVYVDVNTLLFYMLGYVLGVGSYIMLNRTYNFYKMKK